MNDIKEIFSQILVEIGNSDDKKGYKDMLFLINQASHMDDNGEILGYVLSLLGEAFSNGTIKEDVTTKAQNKDSGIKDNMNHRDNNYCEGDSCKPAGFKIGGKVYDPMKDGPVDNAVAYQFSRILPRSLKLLIIKDLEREFGNKFPHKEELDGRHREW